MATRRDFVMIAEVLRTTAMTEATRERLAQAFATALDEQIPGFDAGKFVHEATRGTRSGDEAPTLTIAALEFTPAKLRADWLTVTDFTVEERAALDAAPDGALASGLVEGLQDQRWAAVGLREAVHDVATDAVLRKAEKIRQRSA